MEKNMETTLLCGLYTDYFRRPFLYSRVPVLGVGCGRLGLGLKGRNSEVRLEHSRFRPGLRQAAHLQQLQIVKPGLRV